MDNHDAYVINNSYITSDTYYGHFTTIHKLVITILCLLVFFCRLDECLHHLPISSTLMECSADENYCNCSMTAVKSVNRIFFVVAQKKKKHDQKKKTKGN